MRNLQPPKATSLDAYRACTSRVQDIDLRSRLQGAEPLIALCGAVFDDAAARTLLHTLKQQNFQVANISKEDMEKIYTRYMVPVGSPGRGIYDQIKLLAKGDMCPLCGCKPVKTLDHHLPKSSFHTLVVHPVNLIPACSDCNKQKSAKSPTCSEEETLHPYFDNIEGEKWLRAAVNHTSPVYLTFGIVAPPSSDPVLAARVRFHFETFQLQTAYRTYAANELSELRVMLGYTLDGKGSSAVNEYLRSVAESKAAVQRNSWQTAMYDALAADEWYCRDGFR